mgnify:CR=1 FL=1
MTYKEALRELKDSIIGSGYQCHIETYQKAIEALKKQIPKKPEYTDEYFDTAYCPNCGNYEFENGTATWGLKYCPECGQAIDWSENE